MKVTRYGDIEQARRNYLPKADRAAHEARARAFTGDPGQAASYQRKEAQARDYLAGEEGPFPWLEKHSERTGETVRAVAEAIIARADEWEQIAAAIEAERIAAKQAIRAATTVRAMHDAIKALEASLNSITDHST